MSDALDRLRKQKRPTVPPRTAEVGASEILDISQSGYLDSQISTPQNIQPQTPEELTEVASSSAVDMQNSENPDIQISRSLETTLQVKQTTFRLEADVAAELQSFCRQEGICREVLVEALFLHYQRNPDVMAKVLETALSRHQVRVQAANVKRARSMAQRFS